MCVLCTHYTDCIEILLYPSQLLANFNSWQQIKGKPHRWIQRALPEDDSIFLNNTKHKRRNKREDIYIRLSIWLIGHGWYLRYVWTDSDIMQKRALGLLRSQRTISHLSVSIKQQQLVVFVNRKQQKVVILTFDLHAITVDNMNKRFFMIYLIKFDLICKYTFMHNLSFGLQHIWTEAGKWTLLALRLTTPKRCPETDNRPFS